MQPELPALPYPLPNGSIEMKRHRVKALREKGWPLVIEDFWIGFEKFLHVGEIKQFVLRRNVVHSEFTLRSPSSWTRVAVPEA